MPPSLYAQWRVRGVADPGLREGGQGSLPSERLVQEIWYHQRLLRDKLRTLDGRKVRVLHPGFWNHEPGPDFRGAVLQFNSDPPLTGDVEVDLVPGSWRGHGHDRNPQYQNVVLHLVWESGGGKEAFPTLPVSSVLDAPLKELISYSHLAPAMPVALAGKCSAPLRDLPAETLQELLLQAARIRLQSKAAQFQWRARQVGWEQSLWEGLFRALGYKHNVWPMQNLAELLPFLIVGERSATVLQARLLGVGGLLPAELSAMDAGTRTYLRRIWDHWWREREQFSDLALPRLLWRYSGTRPANHPQRRLALAAHWLASGHLLSRLERWLTAAVAEDQLVGSLLEVVQVERDPYWSWHWTFRSARLARPQGLLGAARVTDLAVNVILPWFWMRAVAGKNAALEQTAEQRYFAWPGGEDNAVQRLARQRLLRGAGPRLLRTAAAQQGLLQITHDFCEHSNAICEHCLFPELVRSINP